jgi:hypothetical protein
MYVSSYFVPFYSHSLSLYTLIHLRPVFASFFVFGAQFFLVRVIRRQDPLDRGAAAAHEGC